MRMSLCMRVRGRVSACVSICVCVCEVCLSVCAYSCVSLGVYLLKKAHTRCSLVTHTLCFSADMHVFTLKTRAEPSKPLVSIPVW